MKKIAILVFNNFTHDKRVMNIATHFYEKNYQTSVFAAKTIKELKSKDYKGYNIFRISLLSSLMATPHKKTQNSRSFNGIKSSPKYSFYHNHIRNNILKMHIIDGINEFVYSVAVIVRILLLKPEILYCNDLDTLLPGFIAARLLKSRLIFDSHELFLFGAKYEQSFRLKKYFWNFLQKKLIHKADAVIVTTKYRAEILKNQYDLDKVYVLQNCPKYDPIGPHDLFREEYSLPKENTILLYQGGLTAARGIFELVDIVSEIGKVNLIFMGMGKDKQKLKDYIRDMGLTDKIFVKDAVDPEILLQYTSSADIGLQLLKNVNLNHYSTISNKIFEYIMSGIAIIASDFPEIKNILEKCNIGYCIDPEDKKGIRSLIENLASDKKLLEKFKRNSIKSRVNYSWEKCSVILDEIISKLEE